MVPAVVVSLLHLLQVHKPGLLCLRLQVNSLRKTHVRRRESVILFVRKGNLVISTLIPFILNFVFSLTIVTQIQVRKLAIHLICFVDIVLTRLVALIPLVSDHSEGLFEFVGDLYVLFLALLDAV